MEFEDVDERVEWEARRVAAAFGVEEWQRVTKEMRKVRYSVRMKSTSFYCVLEDGTGALLGVLIGSYESTCGIFLPPLGNKWIVQRWPAYNDFMVRGLYRLGIGDELLDQLNSPLSAHEKLELRLNFPRELWPKKWVDEEDAAR